MRHAAWALDPHWTIYTPASNEGGGSPESGTASSDTGSAVSHAASAGAGFAVGAGTGAAMGYGVATLAAFCPVLGVAVGVGLLAYGAYGLATGGAEALWNSGSRIANGNGTNSDYFEAGLLLGGLATGGEGEGEAEAAANFDAARASAFERAGMTDPQDVIFSKVDPETGTVVEFKGPGGAKVAYDGPHDSPGPGHDSPHVGWQTGGKRGAGGAGRGTSPTKGRSTPRARQSRARVTCRATTEESG